MVIKVTSGSWLLRNKFIVLTFNTYDLEVPAWVGLKFRTSGGVKGASTFVFLLPE